MTHDVSYNTVYCLAVFFNFSAFNFRERAQVPERFLPILDDHERMLEALRASNQDWIAVLPPHITGKLFLSLVL